MNNNSDHYESIEVETGETYNRKGLELLENSPTDFAEEIELLHEVRERIRTKSSNTLGIYGELYNRLGRSIPELQKILEELRNIQSLRMQNLSQAFNSFNRSAELNDAEGMWNLGWRYYLGEGIEKSDEKAIQLWKKAASYGHNPAIERLTDIGLTQKVEKSGILGVM